MSDLVKDGLEDDDGQGGEEGRSEEIHLRTENEVNSTRGERSIR